MDEGNSNRRPFVAQALARGSGGEDQKHLSVIIATRFRLCLTHIVPGLAHSAGVLEVAVAVLRSGPSQMEKRSQARRSRSVRWMLHQQDGEATAPRSISPNIISRIYPLCLTPI